LYGLQGPRNKKPATISMSLINAEGEEPTFFSPPHAVMVPPVGRIDKIFDSKMTKLIAEREKRADAQENTNPYSQDDENNASLVHNFLSDGLDLKQVHRALFHVLSIFLYAFFLLLFFIHQCFAHSILI
jgi:hypothetical protein